MRYNFVEMTGSSPVSPSNNIMDNQEIYDLYVLQSKNVRRLKKVQKSLVKDINFYLQKNDDFQVEIKQNYLHYFIAPFQKLNLFKFYIPQAAFLMLKLLK